MNSSKNTFFYDEECDFCARSAIWLKDHTGESLNLSGLENPSRQGAALFIDNNGRTHSGRQAVAAALSLSPSPLMRGLSKIIRLSGPIGALTYKAIARYRRALPAKLPAIRK